MFFQPFFHAIGWLHVLHTALSFHGGSMSYISQNSFKCFMAFCCSSTFNLGSFFTLLAFSLSYFGLPFYCLSPYFPNIHILLHFLFFLLNNDLITVFFNLIFWGAFPKEWFTCFIHAIVYFLSIAEHFVGKFNQSSVCS